VLFDPCKKCLVRAACSNPCYKFIDRLTKNEKIVKKIEKYLELIYIINKGAIVIFILGLFLIEIWSAFINGAR
jgi:sulfatase maturation enzyme AslB (radical SAM superfamily)